MTVSKGTATHAFNHKAIMCFSKAGYLTKNKIFQSTIVNANGVGYMATRKSISGQNMQNLIENKLLSYLFNNKDAIVQTLFLKKRVHVFEK